jgi:dethiobiotin synthetase
MDCFVTGTDTGIGKSFTTAVLLRGLAARGLRAAGMKPLAAGATREADGLVNEDVELLRRHASADLPRELVCPCIYEAPTAPHIAARLEGREIDLAAIAAAYAEIRRRADRVLVEGIGGWALPLTPQAMLADLVRALDLPVVLVVGLRLGGLNHALLSARAIVADGLRLVGWIGNVMDAEYVYGDATFETLREMVPAPCLGHLPWQPDASPAALVGHVAAAVELLATP